MSPLDKKRDIELERNSRDILGMGLPRKRGTKEEMGFPRKRGTKEEKNSRIKHVHAWARMDDFLGEGHSR